jgi:hypothetical protein
MAAFVALAATPGGQAWGSAHAADAASSPNLVHQGGQLVLDGITVDHVQSDRVDPSQLAGQLLIDLYDPLYDAAAASNGSLGLEGDPGTCWAMWQPVLYTARQAGFERLFVGAADVPVRFAEPGERSIRVLLEHAGAWVVSPAGQVSRVADAGLGHAVRSLVRAQEGVAVEVVPAPDTTFGRVSVVLETLSPRVSQLVLTSLPDGAEAACR